MGFDLSRAYPKGFSRHERRSRVKFLYHVAYLNEWSEPEDLMLCVKRINPDFDALYHHYKATRLIPYFNKWVVSFVRHVDYFIDSNRSIMYVVKESLLTQWSS